uniref:autotransporter family protein n=1 Tax=Castellaniella defragrans TaxID=75697 RepID=UPI00333F7AA4
MLAALPVVVLAQTWAGESSSDWNDPRNWSDKNIPKKTTSIIINSSRPVVADGIEFDSEKNNTRLSIGSEDGPGSNLKLLNVKKFKIGSLDIAGISKTKAMVEINNSKMNASRVNIGNSGDGKVWIHGSEASLDVAVSSSLESIVVGGFKGGVGLFTAADGAQISAKHLIVGNGRGGTDGGGLGTVVVDNAKVTLSGDLTVVGRFVDTSIEVKNGGTITFDKQFDLGGFEDTSTGHMLINGAGSKIEGPGRLATIGWEGKGIAEISDHGKLSATDIAIGYYAIGDGDTLVTRGGSIDAADDIAVGLYGKGILTLSDGGQATAGKTMYVAGGITDMGPSNGVLNIGAAAGQDPANPGFVDAGKVEFGLGNGRIVFNHTDVSGGYAFNAAITGGGAATSAVDVYHGVTVMTGASDYLGATTIHGGRLAAGADRAFSPNSTYAVQNSGALDLAGFSQTVAGLSNSGLVDMGAGTTPGAELTVKGDYVGNGGVIAMNTVLAGDGSPTDRLVIDGGSASGDTVLRFTNMGGTGEQTAQGIQVVRTDNGGTTETTAFSLGGQRYTAGAYEYVLVRKDQDWFLTSEVLDNGGGDDGGNSDDHELPIYRPEAAVYAPIPAMARALSLATLGTLHERVGEEENLRGAPSSRNSVNGAWGRLIAQHQRNQFDSGARPTVEGNFWGLQTGADLYRRATAGGHRDHAGLYVTYGGFNSTALRGDVLGGTNITAGSLRLEGPSLGAYWTHFGPTGWYVDAVAQGSWYDVKASSSAGSRLDTKAHGVTASLEHGYPLHFGENGAWLLEPQAQVIYQRFSVNGARDDLSRMSWNADDAWIGRLGLRLQHTHRGDKDTLWQTYARVNLWRNFTGRDGLSFDGNTPIDTRFGGTAYQLAGGLTARIGKRLSLYGEAGYLHSIGSGPQRQRAFAGTFGLRFNY